MAKTSLSSYTVRNYIGCQIWFYSNLLYLYKKKPKKKFKLKITVKIYIRLFHKVGRNFPTPIPFHESKWNPMISVNIISESFCSFHCTSPHAIPFNCFHFISEFSFFALTNFCLHESFYNADCWASKLGTGLGWEILIQVILLACPVTELVYTYPAPTEMVPIHTLQLTTAAAIYWKV